MKCGRCGGAMVYERFYCVQEYFSGWRCISCGEILDEVIIENRLYSESITRNGGRIKNRNFSILGKPSKTAS